MQLLELLEMFHFQVQLSSFLFFSFHVTRDARRGPEGEITDAYAEALEKGGQITGGGGAGGGWDSIYENDQYNLAVSNQPWRGLSVELCHGKIVILSRFACCPSR